MVDNVDINAHLGFFVMLPNYSDKESVQLNFATINKLTGNIAEVFVHKNVEIDLRCVEEYHQALLGLFSDSFGLLINKIHPYSYSIEAQLRITSLPQIKAIGVLVYTSNSWEATNSLKNMPTNRRANLQKFWHRESALRWLIEEMSS